jgi:hypothetical protein
VNLGDLFAFPSQRLDVAESLQQQVELYRMFLGEFTMWNSLEDTGLCTEMSPHGQALVLSDAG